MSEVGAEGLLARGSLLDRLIVEGARDEAPTAARLREWLARDIENLLNTRRRFISPPGDLKELGRSLLTYGLGDFSNESLSSSDFRDNFLDEVRDLLRRSEPRITSFEVMLLDNPDPMDRRLRFRISGYVTLEGSREELNFDSYVDPVECGVVVQD